MSVVLKYTVRTGKWFWAVFDDKAMLVQRSLRRDYATCEEAFEGANAWLNAPAKEKAK